MVETSHSPGDILPTLVLLLTHVSHTHLEMDQLNTASTENALMLKSMLNTNANQDQSLKPPPQLKSNLKFMLTAQWKEPSLFTLTS